MRAFNDWLPRAMSDARRLFEDTDRKNFMDQAFTQLLRDVHAASIATAIRTTKPTIERYQTDDGVVMNMEWYDPDSAWHLYFGVRRTFGQKPITLLDFYSASKQYSATRPDDDSIRRALTDYFEHWKQ